MPDDADLLKIKQEIYTDGIDVSYVGNSVLIGKLPGGPLRYLHKLFLPIDNTLKHLKEILSFSIPGSYAKFFSFSDGATLFDNTLFVYGIRSSASREISIDNIRPVSLGEQVELRRKTNSLDWAEVGALAAATKTYTIEINPLGVTALCSSDGQRREYPTFLLMLRVLVQTLQHNSGPRGLTDASGEILQIEIDSFIRASRQ